MRERLPKTAAKPSTASRKPLQNGKYATATKK